jgi:hypothetical protein
MTALRSYGVHAEVWRHDPPIGKRDPLISCPGSYQPHKGGPIAPAGSPAEQPAIPDLEDALFALTDTGELALTLTG